MLASTGVTAAIITVAAGALVAPGTRIPSRTLMMGSPAKPRRALTDADLELIHRPTNNYVALMERYRDGR